jgi:hypothetical protein
MVALTIITCHSQCKIHGQPSVICVVRLARPSAVKCDRRLGRLDHPDENEISTFWIKISDLSRTRDVTVQPCNPGGQVRRVGFNHDHYSTGACLMHSQKSSMFLFSGIKFRVLV